MDICFDMIKLQQLHSGLGQYCYHLGEAISRLFSNNTYGFYLNEEQCNIFGEAQEYIPCKTQHLLLGVPVHTKIWHATHQEAKYLPKDASVKKILTIHDLNFLQKYTGFKAKQKLKKLQQLVDHMDGIVFISAYTQQVCLQHLQLSHLPLRVIHNGLTIKKEIVATRPTFIDSNDSFLFTIGIVSAKKNFHTLVEALPFLEGKKLYISGNKNTRYARDIEKIISKLSLADRCFLTGEITEGEKKWMYENCSSFLFPSLSEGFGLPVIEAMSYGKPTLLSTHTSLPEIGGKMAYYFENFLPEEMAALIKKTEEEFSPLDAENNIRHAASFSWDKAAKEYYDFYRLIGGW